MGLRETMPPPSGLIRAVDLNDLWINFSHWTVHQTWAKLSAAQSVTRASLINCSMLRVRGMRSVHNQVVYLIYSVRSKSKFYMVCVKKRFSVLYLFNFPSYSAIALWTEIHKNNFIALFLKIKKWNILGVWVKTLEKYI